jgi:outer membrane lipoprotein carrier protein
MKKYIIALLLSVLFLQYPGTPSAGESDVETPQQVAARLQQRYDSLQSLSFTFHQETRGEMTGKDRQGSGRAIFLRDAMQNMMRWDYVEPDRQVLISDGKEFHMYFAKLQQMIVTPAETLDSDLTYSFFTGRGNILEDFQIFEPEDGFKSTLETGIKSIKIVPRKPQSQVQDIHLFISADSILRRIAIRDHFGTVTVLNFSTISFDSLSGKSPAEIRELFSFTPPEQTEIIYQ